MNDQTALLLATAGTGVLLVAAGWLLLRMARRAANGELRRNPIAGVRTSTTLSSDAAWRAAHIASEKDSSIGAKGLIVGGLLCAASGVLGFVGIPFPTAMSVFTVIALGSAAWALIWTLKGAAVGQRAAKQVTTRHGSPPA